MQSLKKTLQKRGHEIIENQVKDFNKKYESKKKEFHLDLQTLMLPTKTHTAKKYDIPIDIEIEGWKKIGQGGQAEVFKIELKSLPGYFVDKRTIKPAKGIQ